jgi:predicted nucleic acid-binding protein
VIIRFGLQNKVRLIVSPDVLDEIERNLTKKAPQTLSLFQTFLNVVEFEITPDPSPEAVQAVAEYVAAKDAVVVAAAILVKPDYLVTYDRKHLLEPSEVAAQSGLRIVTPDVVVQAIQAQDEDKESDNK